MVEPDHGARARGTASCTAISGTYFCSFCSRSASDQSRDTQTPPAGAPMTVSQSDWQAASSSACNTRRLVLKRADAADRLEDLEHVVALRWLVCQNQHPQTVAWKGHRRLGSGRRRRFPSGGLATPA